MELSKEGINALNWGVDNNKVIDYENNGKVVFDISDIKIDESKIDESRAAFISNALIIPAGADVTHSGKVEIKICPKEKQVLPRPVIRDGNGKLVKYYSLRDWYLKLQEEIFEVSESIMADVHAEITAEELADVITVCISYLEYLGYDEKARSEIFAKVNAKNEKRGYFKEC